MQWAEQRPWRIKHSKEVERAESGSESCRRREENHSRQEVQTVQSTGWQKTSAFEEQWEKEIGWPSRPSWQLQPWKELWILPLANERVLSRHSGGDLCFKKIIVCSVDSSGDWEPTWEATAIVPVNRWGWCGCGWQQEVRASNRSGSDFKMKCFHLCFYLLSDWKLQKQRIQAGDLMCFSQLYWAVL